MSRTALIPQGLGQYRGSRLGRQSGEIVAEGEKYHQSTREWPARAVGRYTGRARAFGAISIENASVEAGENVIVSDGLINNDDRLENRVICQGDARGHSSAESIGPAKRLTPRLSRLPRRRHRRPISRWVTNPKSKEKMDASRPGMQVKRKAEELDKKTRHSQRDQEAAQGAAEDKEASSRITHQAGELVSEVRGLAKEIETTRST